MYTIAGTPQSIKHTLHVHEFRCTTGAPQSGAPSSLKSSASSDRHHLHGRRPIGSDHSKDPAFQPKATSSHQHHIRATPKSASCPQHLADLAVRRPQLQTNAHDQPSAPDQGVRHLPWPAPALAFPHRPISNKAANGHQHAPVEQTSDHGQQGAVQAGWVSDHVRLQQKSGSTDPSTATAQRLDRAAITACIPKIPTGQIQTNPISRQKSCFIETRHQEKIPTVQSSFRIRHDQQI
ncbi:hypothetical protein ACLOJK_015277 [Asimina triloba]